MFAKLMLHNRLVAAGLSAGLLGLAGCGSITAEDFKSILGGVTEVAQAGGQFEASRRAGRASAAGNGAGTGTGSNYTQSAAAANAQAAQAQASTYAALSCTRLTQRGGAMCMENGCGRTVSLHARMGNGSTGSLAVSPGQCLPVGPGTTAVACAGGDRFDWGRSACISS